MAERWLTGGASGEDSEILLWVQSWGPRVEVIDPEALRRRWLEEARLVVARAIADQG